MPSEEMHDISLINGRPFFRQRGSGHLAVPGWFSDTEPRLDRSSQCEPAHETNRWRCRVHVDRALKLCGHREGLCACQGQNRIREIRPSGIAGGPGETWPWLNWEPTPQPKGRDWKPSA
jgi:hypothetical protein